MSDDELARALDLAADQGLYINIDNGRPNSIGRRWTVEIYASPMDHDLRLRPLATSRDNIVSDAVGRALDWALDSPDVALLLRRHVA